MCRLQRRTHPAEGQETCKAVRATEDRVRHRNGTYYFYYHEQLD